MSPTMSFQLAPDNHAPSRARQHVRQFLATNRANGQDPSELQFVSLLLTSELVTHALEHGHHEDNELLLVLQLGTETLHTELSLDDVTLPIDTPPRDEHQFAYGLAVVESLARRWGADRTSHGTCLWFDLDVAPTP